MYNCVQTIILMYNCVYIIMHDLRFLLIKYCLIIIWNIHNVMCATASHCYYLPFIQTHARTALILAVKFCLVLSGLRALIFMTMHSFYYLE